MKLNKAHVCNLGVTSDIVEEMLPNMCQPSKVIKNTIERFNDYNASLHLKATFALDDIKTDVTYSGYVEEEFFKLKARMSQNYFEVDNVKHDTKI